MPDYHGRPPARRDADHLLWVPRIFLFPLYAVSEYFVRLPLGALMTWAEREKVPALLIDFFTFGEERDAGFIPTAFVDFGFRSSVGLYFFANNLGTNDLSARLSYGGDHWRALRLKHRLHWHNNHEFYASAEYLLRPDWVYAGLGPESRRQNIGRYSRRDLKLTLGHHADLWRSSKFEAALGIHDAQYAIDERCCGDPSVAERVTQGAYPTPTGSVEGFVISTSKLVGTFDTRRPRNLEQAQKGTDYESPPGDGVALQLRGKLNVGLNSGATSRSTSEHRYEWATYGSTLSGFVDLTGEQRVLSLNLIADFADPIHKDGTIPFDELVSLGGPRPMQGFLEGRLRDRRALVALLDYRWPVWVWLDGSLHYAIGNVFDSLRDDWKPNQLRNSFGIGIQSNRSQETPFQLLLALGTRTFDSGAHIDSVRIAIGSTHGY